MVGEQKVFIERILSEVAVTTSPRQIPSSTTYIPHSMPPSIAIIGAGPAGLTLASLLTHAKVDVKLTIFEHDASATSRPDQGGTLDLHTETGLAAITKCGLWDTFLKHARYEGEEMIITDKNATTLVHKGAKSKAKEYGNPTDRPEIDRQKLKEILLESVPSELVKWDHHLREVKEDGTLVFDGKEKVEGPFDLIVGADGAWSKVRTRLSDVKPMYSGVSGCELEIKEPANQCPRIDKMVGRGSFIALSDCKFLSAQRMGDNSLKVRSWDHWQEGEAKDTLEKEGKKGILDKVLARHAGWAPEITELLQEGDVEGLHIWSLYELPVGTKWKHEPGFTLIGDAASLMTPFSGEGVNKAMKDSLELAELIERSQADELTLTLDQAVLSYEQEMFPRAEFHQRETMDNKLMALSPQAPIGIFTLMLKNVASQSRSNLVRMLGTKPVVVALYSYLWTRIQIGWAIRTFWRQT